MNRLKKVSLLGALMLATILLASASEAQASHLGGLRGGHYVRQYKVYHFTGHHHTQYVVPPNRFRKNIVNNSSYRYRHVW
jgi:hypothetical protein